MGMAKGKGTPSTPKQEMEARHSKPWTLKEFWGKPAWDWMELLIVPVMLLLITVAFTWQQNSRQEAIEEQRAQDLALQGYLDQMGTLMLEDLSDPKVQTVMRARTLTVLRRLEPSHKREVMQFLLEAELVQRVEEKAPIINLSNASLSGANLSGANLSGADLSDADLSGADLSKYALLSVADLSGADLSGADLSNADLSRAGLSGAILSGADLSDADLSGADLRYANLSGAEGVTKQELEQEASDLTEATMPDGSMHP
jgi:uncharacterized protein YjbI with pentapeptide repeats